MGLAANRRRDVVDVDVEVKLLRAHGVGESGRLMLGGALERQSGAIRSHHDHPVAVGTVHLAAKHVGVELRQPCGFLVSSTTERSLPIMSPGLPVSASTKRRIWLMALL